MEFNNVPARNGTKWRPPSPLPPSSLYVCMYPCLKKTPFAVVEPLGYKSSIGVFLWATDSAINDQVTGRAVETA